MFLFRIASCYFAGLALNLLFAQNGLGYIQQILSSITFYSFSALHSDDRLLAWVVVPVFVIAIIASDAVVKQLQKKSHTFTQHNDFIALVLLGVLVLTEITVLNTPPEPVILQLFFITGVIVVYEAVKSMLFVILKLIQG